jgi:hypothetical protein
MIGSYISILRDFPRIVNYSKLYSQGNRIIKPLKKKKKEPTGKRWRGNMDIRTELALIPDPRIERCKKHNLVDILLLCIIAMVCGVESVEDMVFSGKPTRDGSKSIWACPTGYPARIPSCGYWAE